MTREKRCQVCAKPIADRELCFEKEYRGNSYYACCPMCFSILQRHSEKYTGGWFPKIKQARIER
ncbi:MAG: transcriptional regulator [Candidatus Abyssubacteria bacterium]|nr:transcriptional regulator [Candidatus Abyssubacteria bacterium]